MAPAGLRARLAGLLAVAGMAVCLASETLEGANVNLGSLVQTGELAMPQSRSSMKPLKLCDCYFKQSGDGDDGGKPEDLTCDAEGFFIAGFERAGVFSVR